MREGGSHVTNGTLGNAVVDCGSHSRPHGFDDKMQGRAEQMLQISRRGYGTLDGAV